MLYTQQHSTINGRGVWHYLIDTALGHIHVVEYEQLDRTLKRYIFDGDNERAEVRYRTVSKLMLCGKI